MSLTEEAENLRNENGALKRAVESKGIAIGILRTELEECQKERDEFRLMAETQSVLQPLHSYKCALPCGDRMTQPSAMLSGSENTLAQLLSQSKEDCKQLRLEVTDLRCRLHDAYSDLKILRAEKSRSTDLHQNRLSVETSSLLSQQERESLIEQLERVSSKCQAQEVDVRCLLEEREELIKEKDEIRHKLHRLNYILNILLSRRILTQHHPLKQPPPPPPLRRTIDLDAIITENRYLQQRLKQLDEEKSLAIANSSKYKSALESCRISSTSLRLGHADNLIMSQKQVSEFLKQYKGEVGENAEKNLKFLCIALLDSLNLKSRLVKTQKAANKMLIERASELERRLAQCEEDEGTPFKVCSDSTLASTSLMEGYNPYATFQTMNDSELKAIVNEIDPKRLKESEIMTATTLQQDLEGMVQDEHYSSLISRKNINIANFEQNRSSRQNKDIYTDSNSDSEEIVPLESIDNYISNLKQKRSQKESSNKPVSDHSSKPESGRQEICTTSVVGKHPTNHSPDTSFEIDISDYDSNDENLEQTLQNWQDECDNASCSKNLISKLSPKRSVSGLLRRHKASKIKSAELPENF